MRKTRLPHGVILGLVPRTQGSTVSDIAIAVVVTSRPIFDTSGRGTLGPRDKPEDDT
jgi:hypothetical protein